MPDDYVPTLIGSLRVRLEELEAEKRAITRALRSLEVRAPRVGRRNLPALLVESIRDSPGSRGSFLALEFGVSPGKIAAELNNLEEHGSILKRGLGWELSSTYQSAAGWPLVTNASDED